jgi:hypothetical protein
MANPFVLPDSVLDDVVDALQYSLNRVSSDELGDPQFAADWRRVNGWLSETRDYLKPTGSAPRPDAHSFPISSRRLRQLQTRIDEVVAQRNGQQHAGKAKSKAKRTATRRPLGAELTSGVKHAKRTSIAVGLLAALSLGLVLGALFAQGDVHTHILYGGAAALALTLGAELYNYSRLSHHGHLLHSIYTPFKHSSGRVIGLPSEPVE